MPFDINSFSPVELAEQLSHNEYFILLHSSMKVAYTGARSIIAIGAEEIIKAEDFTKLEQATTIKDGWNNCWFGYFGYGLKNSVEKLAEDEISFINAPKLYFIRPKTIAIFDHEKKQWNIAKGSITEDLLSKPAGKDNIVKNLSSNFSRVEYLQKVTEIKSLIEDGIIYQANLTRKFFGEFKDTPDNFALFKELCEISPAPYSAFIKFEGLNIISSSPEQFLKIDKELNVETRPIKGSATNHDELAGSSKDKAENLMITDLMRNDLSRICEIGTVKVNNLFEITDYATISHMQSTVTGRIKESKDILPLVKACFPPGSMTGAPKIKAMETCSELEKIERGIYSGALGYINNDNECELSVVIRTIVIEGKKFEFQVGGGIVYDSTPEKELNETYIKARAIAKVLNIEAEIRNL